MTKIKRMDIKEFREKGYLQEVNRQFLHPLGMALEVQIDENGNERLGGIWDYRNDSEGIIYDEKLVKSERFQNNIKYVKSEWESKEKSRTDAYGFMIQE